jgi:uroporphyrinogen-III synthase
MALGRNTDARMTSDAKRPIVALLETRMSNELARLVEKHGGAPLCAPAVQETPEIAPSVVSQCIEALEKGRYDAVIFMTGVGVSLLFELAEQLGRRSELVTALRNLTTVCRGPKPSAALRGFGVPPTLSAREPFTAGELIDALSGVELAGRPVLLFHYGERSETLAETLLARQVALEECWLYRWRMPEDTSGLERLVRRIVDGEVDALAITCQIQFRHLYLVAERMDMDRELVHALNDRVTVAAVGPTCNTILEAHGVRTKVMPEHPKMGPLVIALMRHLEQHRRQTGSGSDHPLITH